MSRSADDFDDKSTVLRPKFDPTVADASFTLEVVEGADAGLVFKLDGMSASRALLGHGPACDVRLSDTSVSRRHAALDLVDRRLRITDLDSKNGTVVDGVAVVDAFLRGGEIVRVGATALRVQRSGPANAGALSTAEGFGRLVGASTEMRRLYPLCKRLASSNVPVIIEGETGTGKEVLAESLHAEGDRSAQPFVVFDCTAVPPNLVESELFGHEKGAFTGAAAARKGVFEEAANGTLLIDEIGDLDLALQPKLLRAIERGEVRAVGSNRPLRVDVRILAATRRDLDREVQEGRFRDDLFHRLAVARVELPPLRRRRGDIPVLVRHFCASLGHDPHAIGDDLLARWENLPWPGNVRELRNVVARTLALGELAEEVMLRPREERPRREESSLDAMLDRLAALPLSDARQRLVEEFERLYIERVLEQVGGNVTRAAEIAGVARRYFQVLRARRARL